MRQKMTKAPGEVQMGFLEVQQRGQVEDPLIGAGCCQVTGAEAQKGVTRESWKQEVGESIRPERRVKETRVSVSWTLLLRSSALRFSPVTGDYVLSEKGYSITLFPHIYFSLSRCPAPFPLQIIIQMIMEMIVLMVLMIRREKRFCKIS